MSAAIQTVTEATFEVEVLQSQLPVLINLYADDSAPCKALLPIVTEVGADFAGKLEVVKINVDRSPRVAAMFEARSVPMLVLVVGGRPVGALQGAVLKHEIVDLVSPHLPGATEEVPAAELQKLLGAKRVAVLDVREPGPFVRAHIPGALNIPITELETHVGELIALRKPIVVYDRSGGDDAKSALKTFEAAGVPSVLLKGGFLGWEGEGLDVEKAS